MGGGGSWAAGSLLMVILDIRVIHGDMFTCLLHIGKAYKILVRSESHDRMRGVHRELFNSVSFTTNGTQYIENCIMHST